MVLKCDLCNLELSNESQFKQHLEGRKHKKLESVRDERERSALRSVFITGLKKDMFVKNLEEYFQKFGKILKIIVDKERHAYAIIEYEDEKCIEDVLSQSEHALNGKQIKVKRRVNKEFVSKISNNTEKKKELMEQYKKELLTINTLLAKCSDFDDQVVKFIDYLKLMPNELKEREQFCVELNGLFGKYFPHTTLSIFGSTANGLACKGSDMDVTILFEEYLKTNKLQQPKQQKIKKQNSSEDNSIESNNSNTSSKIDIDEEAEADAEVMAQEAAAEEAAKNNDYYTEDVFQEKIKTFLTLDLDEQVNVLVRLLQRHASNVQDVRKITNTRCPIIRFHNETPLSSFCDLTINNFLVLENTSLIRLFLDLNANLEKLVFVLRFWFKQKSLHGSLKFNSYTVVWLVVFYLQQINELPTVEWLVSLVTAKDQEKRLFGWNCTFERDVERIRTAGFSGSNLKFVDCLKGFFEFYSTFSFMDKTLLSIRSGKCEEINKNSDITKGNCVNMQDPFDLSHNLTANISKRILSQFQSECSQSVSLLKHCTAHKSASKCWGLIMLFTKKTPELVQKPADNTGHSHVIQVQIQNEEGKNEIDFVLRLLRECMLFDVLNEKRKRKAPILQICNRVDSLGLNSNSNASPKRIRVSDNPEKFSYAQIADENSHNGSDDDTNGSFEVHVDKNTWQGRRNARRDLQKTNSFEDDLRLERAISEKLIELSNNNKEKMNEFNFQMSFFTSPCVAEANAAQEKFNLKIQFDLLDENKDAEFLMNFDVLVHFLDVYLNNCFQKYYKV